ncbi:uncharacterized protein STEHIDRAFT_170587 [Stereum hirsutum FP-91666 SS1]|uniref:uncharacterized protein n=1 Tax=Stereum hirsutum (strain FP-91666) TaxID=721885 RepID=UPI0004449F36|nr:uncharacterized protein STEHIDRAFT_170587 [Stereum hirsutum FP-91666 SS1]EIM83271.1 hypothetical protein STEHIDRAFT_170587 [Stereum hirsutum FP-91666 SS1]
MATTLDIRALLIASPPTTQAATTTGEKRKRAPAKKQTSAQGNRRITLADGEEVDVTGINVTSVVARPEVLEALKARIIELEDQLGTQPPPVKRARKAAASPDDDNDSKAGPSTSAAAAVATTSSGLSKAEEKKTKVQLKKIFDRVKKECKSDNCKFQGGSKTIKIDEVLEPSEFEAIFGGKGVLIQPTPQNKPKSTVTIIEFRNTAQVNALLGPDLTKQLPLKGNRWSRGGVPTRTFGGGFGGFGSTFSKSAKLGQCDVEIQSLDVNYSKNGMKCTLKFEVGEIGGGGCGYGDWDDY